MKYLAEEMGLDNDKVTLSRPPVDIETIDSEYRINDIYTTREMGFSAPFSTMDGSNRTFIIE